MEGRRVRDSDLDPAVLARPHGVGVRVRSILGDTIVDDIPVESGELSAATSQTVPDRLTLQVPVSDRGTVWEPVLPEDPLNSFGQRLEVVYLVKRAGLADVEIPLGQYRIQSWSATRDVVSVDAVGLLAVLEDARLTVPSSPSAGMTYVAAVEFLVEDLLSLEFDAAVVDEPVASVVQWDEDRLRAILDLLDTWGVRGYVDSAGVFTVAPQSDLAGAPVVAWSDGVAGTVVSAPRGGSRDGVYNAVIAKSSASDLSDYEQVTAQAVAYDTRSTSPVRWDGPYGHVPYFYSSPLILTARAARRSALTILQRVTRFASTREVTAIPDPRIELGDIASVTTQELAGTATLTGEVLAIRLPLTAAQGPASYTISAMGDEPL